MIDLNLNNDDSLEKDDLINDDNYINVEDISNEYSKIYKEIKNISIGNENIESIYQDTEKLFKNNDTVVVEAVEFKLSLIDGVELDVGNEVNVFKAIGSAIISLLKKIYNVIKTIFKLIISFFKAIYGFINRLYSSIFNTKNMTYKGNPIYEYTPSSGGGGGGHTGSSTSDTLEKVAKDEHDGEADPVVIEVKRGQDVVIDDDILKSKDFINYLHASNKDITSDILLRMKINQDVINLHLSTQDVKDELQLYLDSFGEKIPAIGLINTYGENGVTNEVITDLVNHLIYALSNNVHYIMEDILESNERTNYFAHNIMLKNKFIDYLTEPKDGKMYIKDFAELRDYPINHEKYLKKSDFDISVTRKDTIMTLGLVVKNGLYLGGYAESEEFINRNEKFYNRLNKTGNYVQSTMELIDTLNSLKFDNVYDIGKVSDEELDFILNAYHGETRSVPSNLDNLKIIQPPNLKINKAENYERKLREKLKNVDTLIDHIPEIEVNLNKHYKYTIRGTLQVLEDDKGRNIRKILNTINSEMNYMNRLFGNVLKVANEVTNTLKFIDSSYVMSDINGLIWMKDNLD